MDNNDQQGPVLTREDSSDGLLFTILILVAILLATACDPAQRRPAPGAGPAGVAADAENLGDLAVLLSTDRAVYERSDPVFVTFTLANHSGEDHLLPRLTPTAPGTWYIEVLDAEGRAIALPRAGLAGPAATRMERLDAGRFVRVTCPLEACPVLGPVEPSLPPGSYALVGIYESAPGEAHDGPVWSGRLESGPARIEIVDRTGTMLARN
jgi:hypothetical protein